MTEDLSRTPLYDTHLSSGARMMPFAGWDMPIQYTGILDEARKVRSGCGIFDVSHMGRVDIRGPGAAEFLDRVLSVDVPGLASGRARYNLVCNAEGGIIDDAIVYRREDERFLLVPNAGNRTAVLEWLSRWAPGEDRVRIEDDTASSAMIAVQGPKTAAVFEAMASTELPSLKRFRAAEARVAGADAFIARTGYTGEDGFEMIVPSTSAARVWQALVDAGAAPVGLGARDVLRLEAGLLLHGNDMDTTVNPYEAGLDSFVDPDREGYVAGDALRRIRDQGVTRRLVGFTMVERGIPRHGYPIVDGAQGIGEVSSGGHSPTLDTSIGLGYVPTNYSTVGSRFQIDIRDRRVQAEVTALPFYSRRKPA